MLGQMEPGMLGMTHGLVKQISGVVTAHSIVHPGAPSVGGHESARSEHPQVTTDRALRQAQIRHELAHRGFVLHES